MKNFFVPRSDSDRNLWAGNFAAKLPLYAAKYGISNAEVADIQLSVANYDYWLGFKNMIVEFSKKATQFKNEVAEGKEAVSTVPTLPDFGKAPDSVLPGVFIRINSVAQRIKKHKDYSVADGLDLGIEGAEQQVDLTTIKPVISVRLVESGKPEIVWKKNKMSAIELFVDRGKGYEFLAFDTNPNYVDEFKLEPGQTAVWKYNGVYLLNDKRVGQFSDEVKVTVTGQQ